jgi:aquaporin Z
MVTLFRDTLAELIGTFVLVFIGCYAVINNAGETTALLPALAHGLVLVGLIYTYGGLSGAQFNPAVTVALLINAKINPIRATAFIAAQFAGAILAAALIGFIQEGTEALGETRGLYTNDDVWIAALFEAVLTFILVSAIFQAGVFGRAGGLSGVAIGLTLAACILAGGPYTGASLNPARTLGPALVAGNLDYVLPYFVGIFGGGALGGLVQNLLLGPARGEK